MYTKPRKKATDGCKAGAGITMICQCVLEASVVWGTPPILLIQHVTNVNKKNDAYEQ